MRASARAQRSSCNWGKSFPLVPPLLSVLAVLLGSSGCMTYFAAVTVNPGSQRLRTTVLYGLYYHLSGLGKLKHFSHIGIWAFPLNDWLARRVSYNLPLNCSSLSKNILKSLALFFKTIASLLHTVPLKSVAIHNSPFVIVSKHLCLKLRSCKGLSTILPWSMRVVQILHVKHMHKHLQY